MNKVIMIGNLTRDPELRTTQSGDAVCNFTIAVNRRRSNQAEAWRPDADFFRVTAWRQLGENCARWLIRGKKVGIVGSVSATAYMGNDGKARANLEVTADEVEFLSPANTTEATPQPTQEAPRAPAPATTAAFSTPPGGGFVQVEDEDLPF